MVLLWKFYLNDPEEQKICFNYKNLAPLWATENIKKSNKILPGQKKTSQSWARQGE